MLKTLAFEREHPRKTRRRVEHHSHHESRTSPRTPSLSRRRVQVAVEGTTIPSRPGSRAPHRRTCAPPTAPTWHPSRCPEPPRAPLASTSSLPRLTGAAFPDDEHLRPRPLPRAPSPFFSLRFSLSAPHQCRLPAGTAAAMGVRWSRSSLGVTLASRRWIFPKTEPRPPDPSSSDALFSGPLPPARRSAGVAAASLDREVPDPHLPVDRVWAGPSLQPGPATPLLHRASPARPSWLPLHSSGQGPW